ncbi:MAG: hypothetical protein IJC74_02725 [Clostridia bacterium]|nr:hypothetical protein [Clostridia bacterium]
MAEKNKKKTKNKIKADNRFAVFVLVALFLIIVFAGRNTASTVTVTAENVESTVMGKGILTYNEEVHYSEAPGEVLYPYNNGSRVLQGKKIATQYVGEVDDETKEQLRIANEKLAASEFLNNYKSVVTDDIITLKKERKKTIAKIARSSAEGNYAEVGELKKELEIFNSKIQEVESGVVSDSGAESAKNNIQYIENKFGGSKIEFYSKQSGIFSKDIDGLEGVFTPETANSISVVDFNELMNKLESGKGESNAVCKIINNYEWYVSALVNYEDIKDIKPGEESAYVKLRITSKSDEAVEAVVTHISPPGENEMCVVTVKSTKYLDNLFDSRTVDFEIIKKEYQGLKVPADSIYEKDGVRGVLVIKDSVARFVPVDVLYEEKSFAVVKNGSTTIGSSTEELVLYDLVIRNYKRISEGSIVK